MPTATISEAVAALRGVALDPMAAVRTWKSEHPGAKAIGFFSGYVPEEAILAAGALPVRMILPPDPGPIVVSDQYAPTFICSYVRGALDQAIAGHYASLDGIVFPKTCETLTFMREVWQRHVPNQRLFYFQSAVVTTAPSALKFSLTQLDRLIRELGEFTGQPITEDGLSMAIATCNEVRSLLRRCNAVRRADPPPISGADALAISLGAQVLPKDRAIAKLRAVATALEAASTKQGSGLPRIMLTGSNVDHLGFLEAIEAQGTHIVADDLSTTTRHFWDDVSTDLPPREAIMGRYLNRIPDSSRHPSDARGDHVVDLAREFGVQGAIYVTRKYCETHLYEFPYIRNRLAEIDVPILHIETEHQFTSIEQIKTRVGAFIEVLA